MGAGDQAITLIKAGQHGDVLDQCVGSGSRRGVLVGLDDGLNMGEERRDSAITSIPGFLIV